MTRAEWQLVNAALHKALRMTWSIKRLARDAGIDENKLYGLEKEFREAAQLTLKGLEGADNGPRIPEAQGEGSN